MMTTKTAVAAMVAMAMVALTLTTPITINVTCLGAAAAVLDNRARWQVPPQAHGS